MKSKTEGDGDVRNQCSDAKNLDRCLPKWDVFPSRYGIQPNKLCLRFCTSSVYTMGLNPNPTETKCKVADVRCQCHLQKCRQLSSLETHMPLQQNGWADRCTFINGNICIFIHMYIHVYIYIYTWHFNHRHFVSRVKRAVPGFCGKGYEPKTLSPAFWPWIGQRQNPQMGSWLGWM